MEPVYHSDLEIPIISLLNGIILIIGFYFFGKNIQKIFKINLIIKEVSLTDYQNILVAIIFSSIILYPICLFFEFSSYILKFFTYGVYIFGVINIVLLVRSLISKKGINFYFHKDLNYILFALIFVGLLFLSFAPVTNADALDYHMFTAKYLLKNGMYPGYLTNFHSSYLSGSGEMFIAIGLLVGSEQFGSILQFSGLISLIGVLKKYKSPYFFYLIIISSPVLIFFVSAPKPQLFTICSSVFAYCLIFFGDQSKSKKITFNEIKKFFLISIILMSSITVKFSFILSSAILLLILSFNYLSLNKLIKVLFIILISYIVVVFPSLIWKYNTFSGNFFELFYSPFSTERYGLATFKQYLTGLSEANLLWFILPTSLGNFTHSLGLGSICILYLYQLRFIKNTLYIISILILFLLISYFFGQFTARFFLEPYLWIALYLARYHTLIKINVFHEFFYRIQSLIFFGVILYGVSNLTIGVINAELRDKVLEKNAMSYTFFRWVNNELKDTNAPIITFQRSIALSNNFPISRDHLFYVNMSKPEASEYMKEIKRINPKFLVFSSGGSSYKKYIGCTTGLYSYKNEVFSIAVRNPLNNNNKKFDIYIYKLDASLMPKCINPDKVDNYSKQ